MTGGIGFSRFGKDSFEENRNLLNKRKLMKENPYNGSISNSSGSIKTDFEELKKWKERHRSKEKNLRKTISLSLFLFIVAYLIIIYLLNN